MSLQMYGCRVVQKALEVGTLAQRRALAAELETHVMRCVRDQNGNVRSFNHPLVCLAAGHDPHLLPQPQVSQPAGMPASCLAADTARIRTPPECTHLPDQLIWALLRMDPMHAPNHPAARHPEGHRVRTHAVCGAHAGHLHRPGGAAQHAPLWLPRGAAHAGALHGPRAL